MQRVYGISFPDNKQLKEWQKFQEEAAKRDHRKLGREHGLFFFNELSPGSCFFTPRGAFIYNTLINFLRVSYRLPLMITILNLCLFRASTESVASKR